MKIQQVERQTGITAQNIRYYEKEGLILPQRDSANSYRVYTPEDVERLKTIIFCRRLGISIPEIRAMLQAECSFRQCVEQAMAEAKAAEEAAAARAELCRSVLKELRLDPELEPADCARVVLRDRSVRKLYEQVIPEEQRKPAKQRYWLLWLTAIPVLLVGILIAAAIVITARFRPACNQMVEMLARPETTTVFSCGEASLQSDYLENKLLTLLLKADPTSHLPWCMEEEDPVVVDVVSGEEAAVMTIWEHDGKICLTWETSENTVKWTLLERVVQTLFRQIREHIVMNG